MRVLVCGGRDFSSTTSLWRELDTVKINAPHDALTIIQGGATGADRLARLWCESRAIPYDNFPANWKKYGKAAGPIRNQRMIDVGKPDLVVAAPGGTGTADMVRRAEVAGIPIQRI